MMHDSIHPGAVFFLLLTFLVGCASPPPAASEIPPALEHGLVIDDELRISANAVHLSDQAAVDVRIAVDRINEPVERIINPRVLAPIGEPANVVVSNGRQSITIEVAASRHDGRIIVDIKARIEGWTEQTMHPSLRIPALTAQKNATTPE